MKKTYLGPNLLCDILQGFADPVHRAAALKDNCPSRTTAHVDIGLRALGNVTEDVTVDYGSCPVSYQSKQAFSAYVLAAKREAFPMVHHES